MEPESQTGIANHYLGLLFVKLARIAALQRCGGAHAVTAKEAVWKAKRMMEENYARRSRWNRLPRKRIMNKYHLAHLFKETVGVSPIQFLIYCRMEAAKRYLRTTVLQVKESPKSSATRASLRSTTCL